MALHHTRLESIKNIMKDMDGYKSDWKDVADSDRGILSESYSYTGRRRGNKKEEGKESLPLLYNKHIDYVNSFVKEQYSKTIGTGRDWFKLSVAESFKQEYPDAVDPIMRSLQDRENILYQYMADSDVKNNINIGLKDYLTLGFCFYSIGANEEGVIVKRIPHEHCKIAPAATWSGVSLSVMTSENTMTIKDKMTQAGISMEKGVNVPEDYDEEFITGFDCEIVEVPYKTKSDGMKLIRVGFMYDNTGRMLEEPYYYIDGLSVDNRSILLNTQSADSNDPIKNNGVVSRIFNQIIQINDFTIQSNQNVFRLTNPPILKDSAAVLDTVALKTKRPGSVINVDLTQMRKWGEAARLADTFAPVNTNLSPEILFQYIAQMDIEIKTSINIMQTIASNFPSAPAKETATSWQIYAQEAAKKTQFIIEDIESNNLKPILTYAANALDGMDKLPKLTLQGEDGNDVEADFNEDIATYEFVASQKYITNIKELQTILGTWQTLMSTIGQTESGLREINDRFDIQKIVKKIAVLNDVDVNLYRSDADVSEIKEARNQMAKQKEAQAQQAQLAAQQGGGGLAGAGISTEATPNVVGEQTRPF